MTVDPKLPDEGARLVAPALPWAEASLQAALRLHRRMLVRGESLVQDGGRVDGVMLVLSGWLAQVKTLEDGAEQVLDFALPGDLVEPAGADGFHASESVTAMTVAEVALLPQRDWVGLLHGDAVLAEHVARLRAASRARLGERMLRLGRASAEVRVAEALVEFCVRLGGTCGATYHLPLTQGDIGSFTGLTAVHVCRVLRRMTEQGLVETGDHMDVRVLDPEAMAQVAGLDRAAFERAIRVRD